MAKVVRYRMQINGQTYLNGSVPYTLRVILRDWGTYGAVHAARPKGMPRWRFVIQMFEALPKAHYRGLRLEVVRLKRRDRRKNRWKL
jgi:hypothetical protein